MASTSFELSEQQCEPVPQRRDGCVNSDLKELRPQQEFSLPPADDGRQAWMFLAGCFWVEAMVWGLPYSYGLFQDFYTTHEPFKSDPSGIPIIGTSALGIMYLGSPVCFAAMQRWPLLRRWSTTAGLVILVVSLIATSFATAVWHLIFTQGVLYAIGGSLLYSPVILFVDEWFVRRKGLAFGVMWAGTGFAGVTVPFLMSWLLDRYHFKTTLRVWAVAFTLISGPLLFVVKARIPESQRHQPRRLDLRFMKSRTFIFLQLGNVIEGLGYFMPTIYLPSYVRYLGIHHTFGTVAVSLMNGAIVFGCIFVGVLIDRFHVTTVILVSTIGATISAFVLWGLASSVPLILIFSITYGFFAGGFSSTYAGIVREIRTVSPNADTGIVFGFIAAGRGIGSIICGPLSESLIKTRPWQGQAALGYGTGYGPLIVFTGVTALFGGVGFGARRVGWI
ncbi:hypothetical protein AJ80_06951 [Polytolypa hystricis UAMH7299]|uniref:Major facilitator superfamily (MFS) profile domain-containing protein n=1 Tax=Polytolypa hystricis (strain UAMH7299) TaxID=1447883 RepID=A0A2B7XRN0_POLH7|nr:hypothetical protein AJ80_06951 [Polytolypa hystricis UAMH7299]